MIRSTPRPPRDVETRAAALIQAALPQVQMQQHDPGGGPVQTYDFDLVYGNGTVEALEVTEATDKSLRDAQGARAAKVPAAVLPAPGLRRSWHLYPTARTRFTSLSDCIPLLAQLEQAGAGRFFSHGKPILWRPRPPACCSSRGNCGWTSTRTT